MWQWVCSPALGCFFPSPPLPAGVQYSSYSVELVTGFAVAGEGGGRGSGGRQGGGWGDMVCRVSVHVLISSDIVKYFLVS